MAAQSADLFDAYFRRADLDGDGKISGAEAVGFFRGANLPQTVLAQVWNFANQKGSGFLDRAEFYNALKLVTVAQNNNPLTREIVQAALYGEASGKIPAPKINLVAMPAPQLNSNRSAPSTQLGSAAPTASQNMAARGPQLLATSGINQQQMAYQQNQSIRPSQGMPSSVPSSPSQPSSSHQMSVGDNLAAPRPQATNLSTDWLSERMVGPNRGSSPSTTQDGYAQVFSGLSSAAHPKSVASTTPTTPGALRPLDSVRSFQAATVDSSMSLAPANGFLSNSASGDVSSGVLSRPRQDSTIPHSAGSLPMSSAIVPASSGPQGLSKPDQPVSSQNSFIARQPLGGQPPRVQPAARQNQQLPVQSSAFVSSGIPTGAVGSSNQPQPQWPRMTEVDIQKYRNVFVNVDSDRDGKISGEQARTLFLSWKVPREVLKQVWDLSDQDNDSMLSLKEFCVAVYLMERFREGRPLPTVFPSNIIVDESLFHTTMLPTAAYGNAAWQQPRSGLQQAHGVNAAASVTPAAGVAAGVRPPSDISFSAAESAAPPSPKKSRVPVLEKHLVDQLSSEEQNLLNSRFKEATEADKKVEELEKEILESKQKIEFYRTKMQELILYKSKCDNRLNEIMERTSADTREVDSLMKKYEERYKQAGDVASKLTIEEATFRNIQEKKTELCQAIVKIEQTGNTDGSLQARVDHIRSDLEDLVKALNDRCRKYGLRAKPTSLVELPFGWQPGINEGAFDWDEEWDKLDEEGFTFVKELTLDVQNTIAPPKARPSIVRKEASSVGEELNAADSKPDKLSSTGEKVSEDAAVDAHSPNTSGRMAENISEDAHGRGSSIKSSPDSPIESTSESPSKEWQDSQTAKSIEADGSPHIRDTLSDHGGAESVVSGGQTFDEPGWGAFDTHYDTDSVWGFNPSGTKDLDHERFSENSFFDSGPLGLNPIRTNSSLVDDMFQKKSSFVFADSVPSTPNLNFGNSPSKYSEMSEDQSFNNFSRFDSFSINDSGLFPPRDSLARFDSIRSTRDSDHGHGFPTFDDSDPFGSTGVFKSSVDSQTPRKVSDNWSAF